MIRCCLCRLGDDGSMMDPTALPGTGFRCSDREDCAERVRAIVNAHIGLAEIVGSGA